MRNKTALCMICALSLVLGGCVSRPETVTPTEAPTPEAAVTPAPTPTPTAEPTPEPTPSPTPEPVIRLVRSDTEREYTLFTGTSAGAAALRTWLLGEGAETVETFIPERMSEPVFMLKNAPAFADIPTATDATRHVRLATDRFVLESGLLEAILPGLENRCGYVVEVLTGDESAPNGWAESASADVVLLSGKAAAAVNRRGFADITAIFTTVYILDEGIIVSDNDITGQTS